VVNDSLTSLISQIIGDDSEMLEWFHIENDLGRKGLSAGKDGDLRPIKTVDDLLDCMSRIYDGVDA